MKILGYEFVRPDLKDVAQLILNIKESHLLDNELDIPNASQKACCVVNSLMVRKAKQAGILDVWFKPVYETFGYEDAPELNYLPNTWHVDSKDFGNVIYHKENGIAWGRIDGHWIKTDDIYSIAKYIIWKPIKSDSNKIMNMLLRYAKKLGLASGVRVLDGKNEYELSGQPNYEPKQGTLLCYIKNDSGGRLLLMSEGEWVKKIEEPKIKDYTWYILNAYDKTLIFHTTGSKGYGLNYEGIWDSLDKDYTFTENPEEWTEASIRYVTEKLTVYARAKGHIKNNELLGWNPNRNCMTSNVTDVILNDKGEWIDDKCIVNGYEATISGEYIKFGCAELNVSWFTETSNRSIKELTLSSGVVLRENDIKSIRAFIKKINKEMHMSYSKRMLRAWANNIDYNK